jgi:low affinity Fe/Cu permease
MKKAYVIFPAVALIVFFGFWWNYNSQYQARKAEKAQQAKLELEAKRLQEARDREIAIKDALEAQERRRAERAIKEAKELADREARQAAIENQNKAAREKDRFAKQVERLNGDIKVEREAIAALEEQSRKALLELGILREAVRLAQTNEKNLSTVLDRIAAADTARAAAEAAAAAASKRN